MGSSASKQETASHVFTAHTPVSFSQGLTDSLQQSSESDSTRAKDLERHIQSRVTAELERLKAQADEKLAKASEAVSNEPFTPPQRPSPQEATPAGLIEKPLFSRIGDWITGRDTSKLQPTRPDLDTPTLQRDIDRLKKQLAERKRVRDLDPSVVQAQENVVKCFTSHEGKPLDCWQEVEVFKEEVRRLEKRFIDSNGG